MEAGDNGPRFQNVQLHVDVVCRTEHVFVIHPHHRTTEKFAKAHPMNPGSANVCPNVQVCFKTSNIYCQGNANPR